MASNTMVVDSTTSQQKAELEGVDQSSALQVPESAKNIGREDIGKEEKDIGSPNESDNEAEKEPKFSPWNSHDDPENPQNWKFGKKVFHTAIPALYGFVM